MGSQASGSESPGKAEIEFELGCALSPGDAGAPILSSDHNIVGIVYGMRTPLSSIGKGGQFLFARSKILKSLFEGAPNR
jgi:hypothetical protein